ncbi:hypothetical protein Poli38472_001157 [Pythium oligandrum]|uniref:DJ-1/PfpI domain-containing protein n=1 Tax=Pythium oligandrum TaxID=41045 RepID=A0A8K1FN47_PYTOL|nr:hypothetical protein Poli38472_001157 [Pythium oligandrum]|eukprot:TMW69001.1 hypothetical protein Poli38472_001157 [Pythium oligandrum]
MVLDRALVVGILLFQNVTTVDYMGPATYLEQLGSAVGQKLEFHTVSETAGGPIQPIHWGPILASNSFEDAPRKWDIFIIPGGTGTVQISKDPKYVEYARAAAENSTDVLTVCTGARILANSGILDGKKATTNKLKFNEIAAESPEVDWQAQARWVVDGKYWSSSGIMAGIDLGHAYVSEKYGVDVAKKIASEIEYVPNTDPANDPFTYITKETPSPSPVPSAPASSRPAQLPFRIGVVLYENTTAMDMSAALTFLEPLKTLAGKKTEMYTIAEKAGGPIQPANQVPLFASVSIDDAPRKWDILVIPGGPGDEAFIKNIKMLEYVRKAATKAKDVLTVSTGSRILAATGLLDGKYATAKKTEILKIQAAYPAVKWIVNRRWVDDTKYWTASGSTAGLDMGFAYVTRRYNLKAAEKIATNTEYVPITNPVRDPFGLPTPAPSVVPAPKPPPKPREPPSSSAVPPPNPPPVPQQTPSSSTVPPPKPPPKPRETPAPPLATPAPSTTQTPGAGPAPAAKGDYVYAGPARPDSDSLNTWCSVNCPQFCPTQFCKKKGE